MQPRYPEAITPLGEQLVEQNGLREAGFDLWAFHPDMLFGARRKWWGDRGPRPSPHEGIDLCLFTDKSGRPHRLDESCRVPVAFEGEIIKIEKDFLGESVYVAHGMEDGQGRRLWTLYGHTKPAEGLGAGKSVRQGEIIATFTKVGKKAAGLVCHLHLSMAWVSTTTAFDKISWEALQDPGVAVLIDPLHAMGCPYRILDPDVSVQSC